MAKAIAIFTGGATEKRQAAIREDGAVFARGQEQHPLYGARWSAWRATGEVLGGNAMHAVEEIACGSSTLRKATPTDCFINNRALFNDKGEIKVRLP